MIKPKTVMKSRCIIASGFLLLSYTPILHGSDESEYPLQEIQVYADTQPFISKNYKDIETHIYLL